MPLLEVRGATKRFPGVIALDGVNLTLERGEVLAVIGENGAGKSTLMKILAGVERLDTGQILLDGRPALWDSVQDAGHAGIALIHQELNLSENLDVAANICLGREPRRYGLLDQSRILREAREALELIGLAISPRTLVGDLSVGQRQMVEIAKSLATHARILIMDEPTSSLSQGETETLFRVVRDLRDQGVSVIYISHRLSEVDELADRALVLRDGRVAGELSRAEIDHDRMVGLMVGRDVATFYSRKPHQPGDLRLEVEQLATVEHPDKPLSFSVCAGEIVGIAGLVGAGRTELLCALFGIQPPRLGLIRFDGKEQQFRTPAEAIRGNGSCPGRPEATRLDPANGGSLESYLGRIWCASRSARLVEPANGVSAGERDDPETRDQDTQHGPGCPVSVRWKSTEGGPWQVACPPAATAADGRAHPGH